MDGPIKRRHSNRRMLRNLLIGIVALLIALVAVFAGQRYVQYKSGSEVEDARAEVDAAAVAIARQVAQTLHPPAEQLRALARDPQVIGLFEQADAAALEQAAARYATSFEQALALRLIQPDKISLALESDANPPLGYASLDLLSQARETRAPTEAELHMPGTPRAHIVMIEPVKNDAGTVIGLLHLSLPPDVVNTALDAAGTGYVELKQSVDNSSPVLFAYHGEAGGKDDTLSKSVPVEGTRWIVTYWPAAAATDSVLPGGWLPAVALGLLVIGVVAVLIGWRQRRGRNTEDGIIYDGAVKSFMEGRHPDLGRLVMNSIGVQKAAMAQSSHNQSPDSGTDATATAETAVVETATVEVPAGIFRTYDIRGLVESELTPEVAHELGRAIGSEASERKQQGMIVGRDGRLSSQELSRALIKGLRSTGLDVVDIGLVATPVLYFATHYLESSNGVMITGSHNGPEYNGMKIVLGGETLSGDTVQALYQRIQTGTYVTGNGNLQTADITAAYIQRVTEDMPVAVDKSLKIVVDSGNGVASYIAPQVYRAMGHDIVELYCEIDGNFPNHHPDPSQPENLQDLIAKVKETGADLGFAFDGDGDRLGVVDAEGTVIWPDRQLMLLAKDVLSRNAGAPIIFDVKCSRYLRAIIELAGGKPLMWKTGHSLIKSKMKEVNAPLAGEMSGHVFFKERWYGFDDAIYTGARLLQVLVQQDENPTAVFADLPGGVSTHELRIRLTETEHGRVMEALKGTLDTEGGELSEVDGLRIDYPDGWGLIRPSNTSPYLVTRFEAEDEAALVRIQAAFRQAVHAVDPALDVPF